MRVLRLSRRSRLRRMARASRRVTASDEPSLGLRPSEKILTPALITAQGASSAFRRSMAQPSDAEPKSSASRYRIVAMPNPPVCRNPFKDLFLTAIGLHYKLSTIGKCALDANKLKDAPNGKAAICGLSSFWAFVSGHGFHRAPADLSQGSSAVMVSRLFGNSWPKAIP